MHDSVMEYVKRMVQKHGLAAKSCLDVGSFDVNGCVRPFFTNGYVGVDMRKGPNVDKVVNAHELSSHFGEGQFDAVVSCEMLEHDDEFWQSMREMGRVLKSGGRLILTTRSQDYGLHNYPDDYWRFTRSAGQKLGELAGLVDVEVEKDPQVPGIFMTGRKP